MAVIFDIEGMWESRIFPGSSDSTDFKMVKHFLKLFFYTSRWGFKDIEKIHIFTIPYISTKWSL